MRRTQVASIGERERGERSGVGSAVVEEVGLRLRAGRNGGSQAPDVRRAGSVVRRSGAAVGAMLCCQTGAVTGQRLLLMLVGGMTDGTAAGRRTAAGTGTGRLWAGGRRLVAGMIGAGTLACLNGGLGALGMVGGLTEMLGGLMRGRGGLGWIGTGLVVR